MARSYSSASSQYSDLTAPAPVTNHPITMMCWFKTTDMANNLSMVYLGNAVTARWFIFCGGTVGNVVRAQAVQTSGASGSADSGTTYTSGRWHHAAGVFASTTSRTAYCDGVPGTVNTASCDPAGGTTINRTSVASRISASVRGLYFNGSLAEVALFDVVLNPEDIQAIANRQALPIDWRRNGLAAYWPIMHNPGTSFEIDLSGGRSLVHTNAPAVVNDHPPVMAPWARRVASVRLNPSIEIGTTELPIVGQDVTLTHDVSIVLTVEPSVLPIVEADVDLLFDRTLDVNAGTLPLTGESVSLRVARRLSVQAASLAIVGQSVAMWVGPVTVVQASVLPITGLDVELTKSSSHQLVVLPTTLPLSGQSVALKVSRHLDIGPASLPLIEQNVVVDLDRVVSVLDTDLPLVESAASLVVSRMLSILPGVVPIVGGNVTLTLSGQPVVGVSAIALRASAQTEIRLTAVASPELSLLASVED